MNAALQDNARHDGLGREGRAQEAAGRDGLPNRPQRVRIFHCKPNTTEEQRRAEIAARAAGLGISARCFK